MGGKFQNVTHPEIKKSGSGKKMDLWYKLSLQKLSGPEVYQLNDKRNEVEKQERPSQMESNLVRLLFVRQSLRKYF